MWQVLSLLASLALLIRLPRQTLLGIYHCCGKLTTEIDELGLQIEFKELS